MISLDMASASFRSRFSSVSDCKSYPARAMSSSRKLKSQSAQKFGHYPRTGRIPISTVTVAATTDGRNGSASARNTICHFHERESLFSGQRRRGGVLRPSQAGVLPQARFRGRLVGRAHRHAGRVHGLISGQADQDGVRHEHHGPSTQARSCGMIGDDGINDESNKTSPLPSVHLDLPKYNSYDNVMAESVNGAYKTMLIWRCVPFSNLSDLKLTTFRWVSW